MILLRGITWKHDRGLAPMLATARRFSELHPGVTISWEARSLQDFGDAPVRQLAERYDLVVIDHPFMGEIAESRCFLPLDVLLSAEQMRTLAADSVGPSHLTYQMKNHQWALAIDAAAQVSGYRADLLDAAGAELPRTWQDVFELARLRPGFVSAALSPVDATICFFTLCANGGEAPFSSGTHVGSREAGHDALEMLLRIRDCSIPESVTANPIAIWERMSTTDDIGYCPLAFGYSNYARNGYRPRPLSFAPIPSAGLGPAGATLGGAGLAISANCAFPRIAAEYAGWIAGAECQRSLYVEAGGQPASRTAWLDAHANDLTSGYFRATLPALEQAWVRPRHAGFVSFQLRAAEAINALLTRGVSIATTLDAIDALHSNAARDEREHEHE